VSDKPYDPTLKALVELRPADWPALAGLPRGPTSVIDADIATVSGALDKALRVEADPPYLVHLEFHAGHDAAVQPALFHLRSALLHHRHRLPVRTVAVLLRPEADSPALSGAWELAFPGEAPYHTFCYRVLRVWQLPVTVLLKGGAATLPLAPISAVTEEQLPGIMRELERRLSSPRLRRQAAELWSATYILMGLRWPRQRAQELFRGVRAMKESVTYQAILEEGEGRGILAGAKKVLRVMGEDRFGPPDAATAAALEAITDLAQLEELGVRLLRVASWQELLGRPAPRRPARRRPHTP
jgi:predicted transposase YdaD